MGILTVCVQLITFWLSHQQPMMTTSYCVWTPSSCSEWAAVRLSSFISWNVTSCISTLVHHMIQSDSLLYLEKLSELIITVADFKGRFHRLRLFLLCRKILSLVLNPMKKTHWRFFPWRNAFEDKMLVNPWNDCKCLKWRCPRSVSWWWLSASTTPNYSSMSVKLFSIVSCFWQPSLIRLVPKGNQLCTLKHYSYKIFFFYLSSGSWDLLTNALQVKNIFFLFCAWW